MENIQEEYILLHGDFSCQNWSDFFMSFTFFGRGSLTLLYHLTFFCQRKEVTSVKVGNVGGRGLDCCG